MSDLVARGYDAVYDALPSSRTFQRIWSGSACGPDYPPEFGHISFLTLAELREMRTRLELGAQGLLLDLACGAGGPGLWMAAASESRLVGIDLSPVGLRRARERAHGVGRLSPAAFMVATFSGVALRSGQADAAMSVDALQYAPDKRAALDEIARVLRRGARLVFTAFELDPDRVSGLPVLGDDPVSDYQPLLEGSGFAVECYRETSEWRERVTTTYEAVLAAGNVLEEELGAPAFAALAFEMTVTLDRDPYRRRVFAVGRKR